MPIPAAVGAAGAWIAQHPIASAILADVGMKVVGGLFGGGQTTPYEEAARMQLGIGQQLIPQLQRQAAGLPTAATQQIQRQLRQTTTQAQQAYAATATARGGGGTPVGAHQARFREAETQALGAELGASQRGAQAQLLGLSGAGMQAVGALEAEEARAKSKVLGTLSQLFAYYQANKQNEEVKQMLLGYLEKLGLPAGTAAPIATPGRVPGYWNPPPSFYGQGQPMT